MTSHGKGFLVWRGGVGQYRRRVPADLEHLDPRKEIRISTGERDPVAAATVAARINAEIERHWRSLADAASRGQTASSEAENLESAIRAARSIGVAYRPAAEIAAGPLADLVDRLAILEDRFGISTDGLSTVGPEPARALVTAVLGGAQRPRVRLSELFATFEALAADRLVGKSDDQVRKWRNPRLRAVANAVDVIGDKPLDEISRSDAIELRSWWIDRVVEEGYDQGSGNKDLGNLAAMIRTIDEAWRLGLENPFEGLRIAGARHNPRVPFDPDLVRARILPGDLGSLNGEARGVVRMCAATGMRPSEVVGLTKERILLDAVLPCVEIRPDGRQLKSHAAARDMPLVGVALDVMREFPDGFPRYRDSPDALSAVVNRALTAAGLRPTAAHTLYSLRHTFKDRLIAIEAPARIQDALMGHAVREIAYGAGPSLAQRAEWLWKVWG